jgi:hypothetical protein
MAAPHEQGTQQVEDCAVKGGMSGQHKRVLRLTTQATDKRHTKWHSVCVAAWPATTSGMLQLWCATDRNPVQAPHRPSKTTGVAGPLALSRATKQRP